VIQGYGRGTVWAECERQQLHDGGCRLHLLSSYCGRCSVRALCPNHLLSVHATRSPALVKSGFPVFAVIYTSITVAIDMLDLSHTQTIAVWAKHKASTSPGTPKDILKNPNHTRTQCHDSHKSQASIPAQELRARKHKGRIEVHTYGESLDCSLIPSPATYAHLVGHADRQHYHRLA